MKPDYLGTAVDLGIILLILAAVCGMSFVFGFVFEMLRGTM